MAKLKLADNVEALFEAALKLEEAAHSYAEASDADNARELRSAALEYAAVANARQRD